MAEFNRRNSTAHSKTTRHYWRRTNTPKPWWPWGLIPFAGLIGTFMFGALLMAPRLEADVLNEVQSRLDGSHFETNVASDGQGVSVRAMATESNRDYLDAIARSTRCDTWAGELTCPTSVHLELEAPPSDAVPTAAIVEPATSLLDEPILDERRSGEIGVVDEPVEADTPERSVDLCNGQFAALFEDTSIVFRTASADIDAGSTELLQQIVDVAARCPGTMQIEGHTDSRGDASMNLALSLARAESVRAALVGHGIDPTRLHANGFGETQPIADNQTSDGRAKNRRIVISVD